MISRRRFVQITLLTFLCCLASNAQGKIRTAVDQASAKMLKAVVYPDQRLLKVESLPGFPDKSSLKRNRSSTLETFVSCVPSGAADCGSRVFVRDLRAGRVFMIVGEIQSIERGRPVDELKWISNDRLSYERWVGPHYGRRYVFDAKLRHQITAFILTDTD